MMLTNFFFERIMTYDGHVYTATFPDRPAIPYSHTVYEKGHTIRHCSTKLHLMTSSLECFTKTCIEKTCTEQSMIVIFFYSYFV